MYENDKITSFIHEEQNNEENNEKFEERINIKNNNILNKLYDLQKLVKKESVLKKLCN